MNFFTPSVFGTMAGSVTLVIMVVNTTQAATGWGARWFGLVIAIAISVAGSIFVRNVDAKIVQKIGMGVLNGFLLYATAFGVQNAAIAPSTPVRTAVVYESVEEAVEDDEGEPGMREPAPYPREVIIERRETPRQFTSPW